MGSVFVPECVLVAIPKANFDYPLSITIISTSAYRVIQNERSIFWEVIVGQYKKKKEICMNMCLIVSGNRDGAVGIYRYKSIVNGNRERELTRFHFCCNLIFNN
jgi:hypothetical protein